VRILAATALLVCSAGTVRADTGAGDAARDAKVDTYIAVFNLLVGTLTEQRERYAETFGTLDPAATPCATAQRPEEVVYYSTYGENMLTDLRRRLREGPRMPQDRLATEMLDAAAIAIPAWNEAYDYYHRDVDATDACALGNAIHARVTPAWTRFFAAEAELEVFLRAYTLERDARLLAEVERVHGRNFRFHHLLILHNMNAISEALEAERPDLDTVTRLVDVIAAAHDEIRPRAERAPRDIHVALRQGDYMTFLLRADAFVVATRQLVRALFDNPLDSDVVRRAEDTCVRARDALIVGANAVRFSRGID
jgi:hypothetical protein